MTQLIILGCSGSVGIALAGVLVIWEELYPVNPKTRYEKL